MTSDAREHVAMHGTRGPVRNEDREPINSTRYAPFAVKSALTAHTAGVCVKREAHPGLGLARSQATPGGKSGALMTDATTRLYPPSKNLGAGKFGGRKIPDFVVISAAIAGGVAVGVAQVAVYWLVGGR